MRTAVVTGANRGIGLEFVRQYAEKGWKVWALCRKSSDELEGLGVNVVEEVDVASEAMAAHLQQKLAGESIDLLVNNAGILRDEQLGKLNYDTMREQLEVNALGPLRVTEALLEKFTSSAKIVLITSRMGSIADNTSGGRYGYRMSKAALNSAGMSLARDLQPKGIAVAILHPGYVATDMVGGRGDIHADLAAERLIQRIEGLNLSNSGTFWHANGEVLPW